MDKCTTVQEKYDLVQKAMELHIPPPPSWQEIVMVEDEKKSMKDKVDEKAVKIGMEMAQKMALKRVPVIDKFGRAYATGRRKTSVARVWVTRGTGNVIINRMMMVSACPGGLWRLHSCLSGPDGCTLSIPSHARRSLFTMEECVRYMEWCCQPLLCPLIEVTSGLLPPQVDYFSRMAYREELFLPLKLTGTPLGWDVWCTVKGGGLTGQCQAIRHGIAQSLQAFDLETFRPIMKRYKLLTFDTRFALTTVLMCLPSACLGERLLTMPSCVLPQAGGKEEARPTQGAQEVPVGQEVEAAERASSPPHGAHLELFFFAFMRMNTRIFRLERRCSRIVGEGMAPPHPPLPMRPPNVTTTRQHIKISLKYRY